MIEDLIQTLMELGQRRTKGDGWSFYSQKDSVHIYRKVDSGQIQLVKGHGLIRAPPSKVYDLISQLEKRPEIDELCEGGEIVESINATTKIGYLRFATTYYCQKTKRDFVTLSHSRYIPDQNAYVVVGQSVTHKSCPEKPDYIRAEIFLSGWILRPYVRTVEPNSTSAPQETDATYVVHTDLKGMVPGWLKNLVMAKQPLLIDRVRKYLE